MMTLVAVFEEDALSKSCVYAPQSGRNMVENSHFMSS